MRRFVHAPSIALLVAFASPEASALITGGEGNQPLSVPGWPAGAASIFNHKGRVAWWEGPPFGGGQWRSECRGDAAALNAVLVDFAKLDVKNKRVVVHDGTGHSFWLAPNREPEKLAKSRIDWSFMVWSSPNWERLRKLPADLNPTDAEDESPPAQLDVYAGGLDWKAVTIPKGITVDDRRLAAHGYAPADGAVIEGVATDLATKRPIGATIRLEKVEPQKAGGYRHPIVAETKADARGRWTFKNVPAAWLRVVVEAEGYAPRVAGYARVDDQPRWESFDAGLARSGRVSGRVVDESGRALADADVILADVAPEGGGRYESPNDHRYKTDAQGRFLADRIPAGKARIWSSKPGYCRPGLGPTIATPNDSVELRMIRASGARVTVDFGGKPRPGGYVVHIAPEGGERIGAYGGSGNIDVKNQIRFNDVPPGPYVLTGQPNPGSTDDRTAPLAVELKAGETLDATLKAK